MWYTGTKRGGVGMERVLVIGCPGAGKTRFARALAAETGLPLFHLDLLWHRPDKTTLPRPVFDAALDNLLARPRWILDGNYLRTLPRRLARCDTVFLLDYPVALCLSGAAERIGKKREDLPFVEEEFDEEFRRWILDFPRDQLPEIYRLLSGCDARVIVFRGREEADRWLEEHESAGQ